MGITQDLVKYCGELEYRQLPTEVVDLVKYLFLDFIGVAIRGARSESSKSMYRFVREMGKGNGVIIGTKDKAPTSIQPWPMAQPAMRLRWMM